MRDYSNIGEMINSLTNDHYELQREVDRLTRENEKLKEAPPLPEWQKDFIRQAYNIVMDEKEKRNNNEYKYLESFSVVRRNGKQLEGLIRLFKEVGKEKVHAAYLMAFDESIVVSKSMFEIKGRPFEDIYDEYDRVIKSGDRRAIAHFKNEHGYTMTKEEIDIVNEDKVKEEDKWTDEDCDGIGCWECKYFRQDKNIHNPYDEKGAYYCSHKKLYISGNMSRPDYMDMRYTDFDKLGCKEEK